jgi:hypothetical protein
MRIRMILVQKIKTSVYCRDELMRALEGVLIVGREIITRLFTCRIDSSVRFAF